MNVVAVHTVAADGARRDRPGQRHRGRSGVENSGAPQGGWWWQHHLEAAPGHEPDASRGNAEVGPARSLVPTVVRAPVVHDKFQGRARGEVRGKQLAILACGLEVARQLQTCRVQNQPWHLCPTCSLVASAMEVRGRPSGAVEDRDTLLAELLC